MSLHTQNPPISGLNIPHGSVFVNNVYEQQKLIIENAFIENSMGNNDGVVIVNLNSRLNYQLADEIMDQGYNVYSQNSGNGGGGGGGNGFFTIHIRPATYLPELHIQNPRHKQLLRMIRYFQ